MAEIGYLLLAVAGSLIIFDQFFDSSGSWIRFRQSEAHLQVLLAQFRFAWAGLMAKYAGTITAPAQVNEFTTLVRDFVTGVELLAEEETTAWAQRFSERLSSFDRNPNLKVPVGSERPSSAGDTVGADSSAHPSRVNSGTVSGGADHGGTVNGGAGQQATAAAKAPSVGQPAQGAVLPPGPAT
jgi:hypothetical protein